MSSTKMWARDPREVLYLRDQLQNVLDIANSSARDIPVREDDDFGFMTMQFLYKQMQHSESVLHLVPSRDAGLIARTMIEGRYQLLWTSQSPEERAKRWRSFSIIHDWRLIQGRLAEGIAVDSADIRSNRERLGEIGNLHLISKPKRNSMDPYHKNWRGGVTLSDMADATDRELYDGPYSELSDWEHWGVSGIGESISRRDGHLTVNPTSERVAGLSLLAAFQSLLETLEHADAHFALNLTEKIQTIAREFRKTLDSFYEHGPILN
jgi:hypothetical protein